MSGRWIILEDDTERRRRFSACAEAFGATIAFWHDAHAMIREAPMALEACALISLDCDLIPPDGSEKWGDGILVADHLATLAPVAPVIVHSTNRDGSRRMIETLRAGGWPVVRVAPIGDDWIERDWRIEVGRIAGRTAF